MKRVEARPGYFYVEFGHESEMYNYLDIKLEEGFKIIENVFLAVEISKDSIYELLSYIPIEHVDEGIKDRIRDLYHPKEILYPDYKQTPLNLIASIRDNFGYKSNYPKLDILDKKYRQAILLILDGMGLNIIENNLDSNSFIRKHFVKEITSIYPTTTAAATTSIKSGLPPITTAWTGWENYMRELNRNVVLFTGINYYNDEPTGVSLYKYIPYHMFYEDMNVKGYCLEPDFTKKYNLKDLLKKSLKINQKNEPSIQYVYYPEPDGIMHEKGPYSKEAKEELARIDSIVEEYANSLLEDTVLLITADHGHTAVLPLEFYSCKPLLRLLKRKPSNDARCITFSVLPGKECEFEKIFNGLFSSVYQLFKSKDAIEKGFFGIGAIHPRCEDFLADYVAVATNEYYFNYKAKDDFVFRSHHAGITRDEMQVPICIIKR